MKLLLVEDDPKVAGHLTECLRERGIMVTSIGNAASLTAYLAHSTRVDMVILDRLIEGIDTKAYLSRIKVKWPHAPILVLSAISTPNERMDLINLGADDYLGKPFSTGELLARIYALGRRAPTGNSSYLQVGDLIINLMQRSVTSNQKTEVLPSKEFLLLRALSHEAGRVWSKNDLLDYIWGQSSDVNTNVVEATITNIRRKLHDLGSAARIKNMRNSGYWIEA